MPHVFKLLPTAAKLQPYHYQIFETKEVTITIPSDLDDEKKVDEEFERISQDLAKLQSGFSIPNEGWEELKYVLLVEASRYKSLLIEGLENIALRRGYIEFGKLMDILHLNKKTLNSLNLVLNKSEPNLVKLDSPMFFELLESLIEAGLHKNNIFFGGYSDDVNLLISRDWKTLAKTKIKETSPDMLPKQIFVLKILDYLKGEKLLVGRKNAIISDRQADFIYEAGLLFGLFKKVDLGLSFIRHLWKYKNDLVRQYKELEITFKI